MTAADVVLGVLYLGHPGAKRHWVIVACPESDATGPHYHAHLLRADADSTEPVTRRPRCRRGKPYRIAVVDAVPAAGVVARATA